MEAGSTTEEPSPQLGPGVAGVVNVGDAWKAQGEQSCLWSGSQVGGVKQRLCHCPIQPGPGA